MTNKIAFSSFIICFLWVSSCESHENEFQKALSYTVEAVALYPTDVTVDGYNLVGEKVFVYDLGVQKKIIDALSSSQEYRPNHPRTNKAFRILVEIEGQDTIDVRASLLTNGKVMLQYKKMTFISDNLGDIVLEFLNRGRSWPGSGGVPGGVAH